MMTHGATKVRERYVENDMAAQAILANAFGAYAKAMGIPVDLMHKAVEQMVDAGACFVCGERMKDAGRE